MLQISNYCFEDEFKQYTDPKTKEVFTVKSGSIFKTKNKHPEEIFVILEDGQFQNQTHPSLKLFGSMTDAIHNYKNRKNNTNNTEKPSGWQCVDWVEIDSRGRPVIVKHHELYRRIKKQKKNDEVNDTNVYNQTKEDEEAMNDANTPLLESSGESSVTIQTVFSKPTQVVSQLGKRKLDTALPECDTTEQVVPHEKEDLETIKRQKNTSNSEENQTALSKSQIESRKKEYKTERFKQSVVKCDCCDKPLIAQRCQVGHIIAQTFSHNHEFSNLCILCEGCNNRDNSNNRQCQLLFNYRRNEHGVMRKIFQLVQLSIKFASLERTIKDQNVLPSTFAEERFKGSADKDGKIDDMNFFYDLLKYETTFLKVSRLKNQSENEKTQKEATDKELLLAEIELESLDKGRYAKK